MGKYILTNKALEDLSNIWNYTFDTWSERQADDYYNLLLSSCSVLAKHPELLGKNYDYILEGLKGFKVKSHILFYRILSYRTVEIVRILHEKMDLPSRLNEKKF